MTDLSLLIPTRNEAQNVGPLLQRLEDALSSIDYEVVFVDDSDDDTPARVLEHAKLLPARLVHRPPGQRFDGLAGAIVHGLSHVSGRYLGILDADLQHPPEILPLLLHELRDDRTDIVVASRYIPGGGVEGLEGPIRKGVSQVTRWLARFLFWEKLASVHDPLSGFFLLRRELLDGIELRPVGYKISLEVLVRTPWRHVAEVPYRFEQRQAGGSKATMRQGLMYFLHLARLWRQVPEARSPWKGIIAWGLELLGRGGLVFVSERARPG